VIKPTCNVYFYSLRSRISDMTSWVEDGGHGVISRPSARRSLMHMSSVRRLSASPPSACDVSSWSIVFSYLFLKFRSNRQLRCTWRWFQCCVRESVDIERWSLSAAATAMWAGTATTSTVKLQCSADHGDQATVCHDIVSLSSSHIATVNHILLSSCVTCIRFFSVRCSIIPSTSLSRSSSSADDKSQLLLF